MNMECDVSIVGAGPAGTLLAYLLAKEGVRVTLVEQHTSIGKAFRGEILNEEGDRVLKDHGLLEMINSDAYLPLTRIEYWERQEIIKQVLPSQSGGHFGIHVPQSELLHAVLDKAAEHRNFTLLAGVTVTELLQNEDRRYTGLKARAKNGDTVMIRSAVTVGADGRYSAVRKRADIPAASRRHGYDLLWALIPAPSGWEPVIRFAEVDRQQLSLFTQAKGMIQIGWNIAEGSYPEWKRRSFEPFIARLTEAFPDLRGPVGTHIRSWSDFVLLDIFSSVSEAWAKDGLVLIGDAAHTMTPTGAFGVNSALKDADVLYRELIGALNANDVSAKRLGRFEQARRSDVNALQQQQFTMESSFKLNFTAQPVIHG
ncbi:FAD-dependent monooxygenase [Paenibacillus sp. M1]|uniref:FAD-dependent monooxygenase n=1 Tax=Paenibacillus haidiansis TaxID=1574488 RepID=A0ABU7VU74_9BACL